MIKKFFDLFKKDKIEFYPVIKGLPADLIYPPIQSKKLPVPNWFKDKAEEFKYNTEVSKCPFINHPARLKTNVSRCPGIRNIMHAGYAIRNWADLYIDLDPNAKTINDLKYDFGMSLKSNAKFASIARLDSHKPSHLPILWENDRIYKFIFKLTTPWKIKCSSNIAFYMLPDYYSDNPWFEVTPGIFDPILNNRIIINLQIFKKEGRLIFPAGMTLCKLIPFEKNKNFQMIVRDPKEDETIDSTEVKDKYIYFSKFLRDYNFLEKSNKNY